MESVFLTISANLTSLACIIGASVLAVNDKEGWGWFLFAGLALSAGAVTLGGKGKRATSGVVATITTTKQPPDQG